MYYTLKESHKKILQLVVKMYPFLFDLFLEARAEIPEIFRFFLKIWRQQKDILKLIDL